MSWRKLLYNKVLMIVICLLFLSCSDEGKTDSELLERDKKNLVADLDGYKVSSYKFGKILIRAAATKDTVSDEFQTFKKDLDRIFNKVYDFDESESLSLVDYVSIYRDYKKMEKFIMKTDEDVFPTLTESFSIIYGDPNAKSVNFNQKDKESVQNIEHAILSAIVILSRDLGKEVSLYECSKVKPEQLPDSEIKTLLQYFRGFLFFEKGYYYLSEDEISRNIAWLDKNKNIDLPYTRAMFKWGNLDNKQTYTAFHGLNHLFRGFDRLQMDREVDEKRALEDFEVFLKDAKEIGLDNELVWSIEAYLYLKNEEQEKAIAALEKLKTSEFISKKEKKRLDESIAYVKSRENDKVLNGFYDKYFLGKIATKYMLSILAEIDWKKVMEEQGVAHTDEIFKAIDKFKELLANFDKYTSTEGLKDVGNEVKDKGADLWDKVKKAVE